MTIGLKPSQEKRSALQIENDCSKRGSSISTAALSAACDDKECCIKGRRSVSFGVIKVRGYERALGDHPCVTSGAPVTLGWRYRQYRDLSVDEYERARGPTRQREQFRMPREARVQILLNETDASVKDIKEAELRALVDR
eukprot:11012971-Ditylum_brightwellii.AAC.1